MDPDASGRDQVVSDVAAGTAFLEIVGGDGGKSQGIIQFSEGQQSGIGGDGGAVKFQADFGIEPEPEGSFFAVTHWVPPDGLRYLTQSGLVTE